MQYCVVVWNSYFVCILVLFIRYFFDIKDTSQAKQHAALTFLLIQSTGICYSIYYMMRKASKSLKNAKYWVKIALFLLNYGIAVNVIFSIYLEILFTKMNNNDIRAIERLSCSQPIWLLNSISFLLMVGIFVIFERLLNH